MRAVDIYLQNVRRYIAEGNGMVMRLPTVWGTTVKLGPEISDLSLLPTSVDGIALLNNTDGDLLFVPGISYPDGDDILV